MEEQALGSRGRLRFSIFVVAVFAMVAVVSPCTALATTAHVFQSSFGREGPNGSEFERAGAVAVDQQSNDIYVADSKVGTVSKFDENGNPIAFTAPGAVENHIGGFAFQGLQGTTEIAVNSTTHEFYVTNNKTSAVKAFAENGEAAKFSALPSNELSPFSSLCGVAVDANGDIYVGDRETGVHIFAESGAAITSFATEKPCNLAVDSHGSVYVSGYVFEAPGVKKFTPSTFPVTALTTYDSGGVVDPEAAYAISIDPSTNDLYVVEHLNLEESQIAQFKENGDPIGIFAKPVEPGALEYPEGIAIDKTTGNVYASDARGERQVKIFVTPPAIAPIVESTSAVGVTSTSANLRAQVNPNHYHTHYRFEYLTEAAYRSNLAESLEGFAGAFSTSAADLGSSGEPQTAVGFAGGLTPDTAYRFRVVAENENGTAESPEPPPDLAPNFNTFPAFPSGLPDGRAYEMVSPPNKAGEVLPPSPEKTLGGSCSECLPGIGPRQIMPMQASPDGSRMAYSGQPFSAGLAPAANEYLASRTQSGWETQGISSSMFGAGFGLGYTAFSPDLSRGVLFQIEPALSPEAPTQGVKSFSNLYLRDKSGSLQPLVTKENEPEHRGPGQYSPFEPALENNFNIILGAGNSGTGTVPAFSDIVFEANDALTPADLPAAPAAPLVAASENNIYEWIDGQLRLVNVLPDIPPNPPVAVQGAVIGSGHQLAFGEFEAAGVDHAMSADGRKVFWSEASGQVYVRIDGKETKKIEDPGDGKFLTAAADGSKVLLNDGCLYDLGEEECDEDLTAGQGGFQGILGAAEDLSRVYFVDTKVLTGTEENANQEHAEENEPNLYTWHSGATTFIGRLLGADNEVGTLARYGDWRVAQANRIAQVSPDGTLLAFTSSARLTGFANDPPASGACAVDGCQEVFEYSANSEELTCTSCNPADLRPLGLSNLSLLLTDGGLPDFRQPGNLSTGGRVFFESQDILSPGDTNGRTQDVYEWEPLGIGGCFREAGCVFLISTGHSSNDSIFVDGTPDGNDSFFITRQQLVPRDKNDQLDLYDARAPHASGEQVGFPEGPSACSGESCKGPVSSIPPTPRAGSGEFSGPGNPPRHRKHHKKRKHKKHSAKHNRGGSK